MPPAKDIEDFLKNAFGMQRVSVERFPPDIKEYLVEYAAKFEWKLNDLRTIFQLMKLGVKELPVCAVDGCTNHVKIKHRIPYLTRGCCVGHNMQLTSLEKFGVAHYMKTEYGQNALKESLMRTYGVDNIRKIPSADAKLRATNMQRYGVQYCTSMQKCKDNKTKFLMEFYGVEHAAQSPVFQEKSITTSMEKYGSQHFMQTQKGVDLLRASIREKYGVDHIMQDPTMHERQQKSRYRFKTYLWADGNSSQVQGYESLVLKDLEDQGYSFDQIKTNKGDMPEIWYFYAGKRRRYFPDIFIPEENLIIEVKSEYTMGVNMEVNQLKMAASISAGFNFKFIVK